MGAVESPKMLSRSKQALQNLPIFIFEVGREYLFVERGFDFFYGPELAPFHLVVVGRDIPVVEGEKGVDQLFFDFRLENIPADENRDKTGDAQLLAGFPMEGVGHPFAVVDMSSHGRVPFPRLNVLVEGPFLQIEFAAGVEDMQMHHRVQEFAPVVAFAPGGLPDGVAAGIDNRENFIRI